MNHFSISQSLFNLTVKNIDGALVVNGKHVRGRDDFLLLDSNEKAAISHYRKKQMFNDNKRRKTRD